MGTVRQDDQWWGGNYSLVGEDERRSGQDVVNFCFVIGRFSLCPLLPDSDDYGDLQEVQKATRCKTGGIQSFPASSLRGINCTVDSLFFLHCNVNDPLLFEMVVEEKERLATETGLPSYKEACRSNQS